MAQGKEDKTQAVTIKDLKESTKIKNYATTTNQRTLNLNQAIDKLGLHDGVEIPGVTLDEIESNIALIERALAVFKGKGELTRDGFKKLLAYSGLHQTPSKQNEESEKQKKPLETFVETLEKLNNNRTLANIKDYRRRLLNMTPEQGSEMINLLNELPKDKQIDATTFQALQQGIINASHNKAALLGLSKGVNAMLNSDIPLTSFMGRLGFGTNKIEQLTALSPHQSEDIGALLTILSDNKVLDSKTFDNIIKSAKSLTNQKDSQSESRAKKIISAFEQMKHFQIPFEGNSDSVMRLPNTTLDNLNMLFSKIKEQPKARISQRTFDVMSHYAQHIGNDTEHAESLAHCMEMIRNANIPLTAQVSVGADRLASLMTLEKERLKKVENILTILAGGVLKEKIKDFPQATSTSDKESYLDKSTLDYIIAEAKDPDPDKEFLKKSDHICNVFQTMRNNNIPIVGNRQPVIKMSEDDLSNFATVLKELQKYQPKAEGSKKPNEPTNLIQKLSQDAFEVLRKNIKELYRPQGESGVGILDFNKLHALGTCMKAMKDNKIPYTEVMDSIFDESNLARLIKMNPDDLKAAAAILSILSEKQPGIQKPPLDEKTFKFIWDNVHTLKDKVTEICDVFTSMKEKGIEISGNRQPIMKMNKEELTTLNRILKDPETGPISADMFKSLCKGITNAKYDLNNSALNKCIAIMLNNKISPSQFFGTDRMERIKQLGGEKEEKVPAAKQWQIAELMEQLSKSGDLDERTFDYIIENHDKLQDIAALNRVLKKMHDNYIPITGNRQALMSLDESKLNQLEKIIDNKTQPQFETMRTGEKSGVRSVINQAKENKLSLQSAATDKSISTSNTYKPSTGPSP